MRRRTNDESDLELLDTKANSDKLRGTPNKTLLLDGPDAVLKSLHVGLIIPRLHLEGNDRLNIETNKRLLHTGFVIEHVTKACPQQHTKSTRVQERE